MKTDELMLKVENVSKIYKLGEIGGTTLRDELQRLKAKIFHKEDPTKKVGSKTITYGERFKALDNISFYVHKGERIGIIGHNGAGKSTLLKLISRVTGPSEGKIFLNGRVASMLEVGTGFHPELTGRENIYMNGAILGMTKKEIDEKMESIIDFSEVRQFIDTPVKRYSSGMYVKLAFSVAAHLDSEIMIMDEVLAVGDVAFQNKCLAKMREISDLQDRTILYVSHNMSTIRQLCDRVLVLNKGKIIFDGDVNEGIQLYTTSQDTNVLSIDVSDFSRETFFTPKTKIENIEIVNSKSNVFARGQDITLRIKMNDLMEYHNARLRISIRNQFDSIVGSIFTDDVIYSKKANVVDVSFNTGLLSKSTYCLGIAIIQKDESGKSNVLDLLRRTIYFKVFEDVDNYDYFDSWNSNNWGDIHFPKATIKNVQ